MRIEVRGQGEGQPEPVLNRAGRRKGGVGEVAWIVLLHSVIKHRLWPG